MKTAPLITKNINRLSFLARIYSKNKIFKDESAAALVTVIILVFILTILSSVILNLLANQTRIIEHDISRIKARYANEAAMTRELERLRRAQSLETTHCVTGRYDSDTQYWYVDIDNSSGPFYGTTALNFSIDYSTPF